MATGFHISTLDRQSKRSTMSFDVADAATTPQLQAVVDAVDGIIRGSAASGTKTVSTDIDVGSSSPPADVEANRGNKWLLRIQDSVNGKIFTNEIGTADNAVLLTPGVDFVDLGVGVGLALKTAVEVVYRSPYGNAGVLLSAQQVNRAD